MTAPADVLRTLQPRLEEALLEGLVAVAARDEQCASPLHRRRALEEQFQLAEGHDCLYDRPGHGFAYASWYHPRRVNQLLTRLLPLADEMPDELVVVDLGAGTGATSWALSLLRLVAKRAGVPSPRSVRVLEIDSSPSMTTAGDLLFAPLQRHLPEASDGFSRECLNRPWIAPPLEHRGAWLVAGHLFDASDAAGEISLQFDRLLQVLNPERVLLDSPHLKIAQHAAAVAGAQRAGYVATAARPERTPLLSGALDGVGKLRRQTLGACGVSPQMLSRNPTWASRHQVVAADLEVGGPQGGRLFAPGPNSIVLDDEQDALARPSERLDVIVGAAGSGKTIVLVEAMARRVSESLRAGVAFDGLFTTRNKLVAEEVVRLLTSSLAGRQVTVDAHRQRAEGDHRLTFVDRERGVPAASMRILNWDKVPTQLLGHPSTGSSDEDAVRVRIHRRERQGWEPLDQYAELRDIEWLVAELRRVIHGQRLRTKADYLASRRTGRVRALQPTVREPVWELLMEGSGQRSFTYLWMAAVDALDRRYGPDGPVDLTFTHAFVDEVQDFTATDLRTLARFVPDANRLLLVGDSGQAMLLGTTFDIPGTLRGRRRNVQRLDHSYRLGRRLAEAVRPLAEAIYEATPRAQQEWVGLPAGTRSGVLGFRPVVLLRNERTTRQLSEVLEHFRPVFDAAERPTLTIAEGRGRDDDLLGVAKACVPDGVECRHETMAAIKGLERTCVVWSTGSVWELDEGAAEFAHTVLTRAVSLAVIVLDEDGSRDEILATVARLRPDRLLFWDEAAEQAWERLLQRAAPTPPAPEDEDEDEDDVEAVVDADRVPRTGPDAAAGSLRAAIDTVHPGLVPSWAESRFDRAGWFHVGETVASCPACQTVLDGFRAPYETSKGRYHYWALLCAGCQYVYSPASLDQSVRRSLYRSSTHRPSDDGDG